jgi:putative transposase
MDLFSRRIVGWRVDDNMEDALILVPLRAALQAPQPTGDLIVHSDHGGQYISNEVQELVSLWRIRPSMS